MNEPKTYDQFNEWADREVTEGHSPLQQAVQFLRQASKACDGSAFVVALKAFGSVCYMQGLVDMDWKPETGGPWNQDKVKTCIDRIAAETISRAGQN